MVACDVSTQPPWSMATSTITEPGFMRGSIARVTSFGAAAPGISTAPITRSAHSTSRSTLSRLENTVMTRAPSSRSIRRSASTLRSITTTCAPVPTAICAALEPTTPAPRMTMRAGGTPATPPSSTPMPPCARSRQ